ncbi:MAG: hypothetical protein HYU36_23275, partial [Planctomycetes bacterium]|nr:hypothetical protein [Planctomycetota bacterium]
MTPLCHAEFGGALPVSISASGPSLSPSPACVGETITATLLNVNAVPPAMVGNQTLAGTSGLTFSYNWGTFSASTTSTATGSFDKTGLMTVRVTVTITGGTATYSGVDKFGNPISVTKNVTATYSGVDKFGNPISVTKNVTGSQSFESDVDVVGVDSITASVPDGQYLCKNQGELVTLTANPKPSGGVFPSGKPVWTTTAGGSFAGSSAGTTVQWQQADGFVSAEADDVVIRATCGTSVVEFKLTVFHVKSTSGVLGTGVTRLPLIFLCRERPLDGPEGRFVRVKPVSFLL